MTNMHDVQEILDRTLGNNDAGNHGAFWRGATRDEFVETKVFGMEIISVGDPDGSNLIRSLKGLAPFGADLEPRPDGAFIRRMPAGLDPTLEDDIVRLEQWIRDGCPDEPADHAADGPVVGVAGLPTDDVHVRYWRSIDYFFLPNLASDETRPHVLNLHASGSFDPWFQSNVRDLDPDIWNNHAASPNIQESFKYIRLHQNRLINDFYSGDKGAIIDSLWKFGGKLLPVDPQTEIPNDRTMNSPNDWFWWVPYLQMSLTAPDRSGVDLGLARGWHVGIVADGLVRDRLEIDEFDVDDPDVKDNVIAVYDDMSETDLIAGMNNRAKKFFGFA